MKKLAVIFVLALAATAIASDVPDLSKYDVDTLRTLCRNLYARVAKLEAENKDLMKQVGQLTDQVAALQQQPANTPSTASTLGGRYKKLKQDQWQARVNDLEQRIKVERQRIFDLNKQKPKYQYQADRRDTSLEQAKSRLMLDEDNLAKLKDERNTYRPEIEEIQVGAIGVFGQRAFKTLQTIDDTNAILSHGPHLFWFEGFDLSDVVDDEKFRIESVCHISGTKRYETVLGSTKTIYHVVPLELSPE